MGFLVTPASFEFSRSYPGELRSLAWAEVADLYGEMEEQARAALAAAGVSQEEIRHQRWAEMRLVGQFHDIEVPVSEGRLDESAAKVMAAAFEERYAHLFHAVPPGYEPMVINWRLRASGPTPIVRMREVAPSLAARFRRGGQEATSGSLKSRRKAYFPEAGDYVATPVYDRYSLPEGTRIEGPAIVEEKESTVVASPGDVLIVDDLGNLRINVGEKS